MGSSNLVEVQKPKLDPKITAKKALKEAASGAAMAGVVATVTAIAQPDVAAKIVDAVSVLLPGPWGVVATLAIPALIAGGSKVVSDWATRSTTSPVVLGKSAVDKARERWKNKEAA